MKKEELKILRDKCLIFCTFLVQKTGVPKQSFGQTNKLIYKAYKDNDVRALKVTSNDIDNQIRELPLYLSLELDKLFQEKLGISIDSINKKMEKEIQKVIKRGKILNEEEYRLIKNREDEIYVDNSKAEEKQQLDRLMEAYEESTGANNV